MYAVRCRTWFFYSQRPQLLLDRLSAQHRRPVETLLPGPGWHVLCLPNQTDKSIRVFSVGPFLPHRLDIDLCPQQHVVNVGFRIFAKEDAEIKKLNEILREKKAARQELPHVDEKLEEEAGKIEREEMYDSCCFLLPMYANDTLFRIADRKTFTWAKLNYIIPVPGGTRRLLHNVDGYIKPGALTALMGAR